MPARMTPPFRADHVGSLLRPPELLRARDDFAAGRISAERLRSAEDEAIRTVVEMQEDVGLQSATDGEFRRASWHMDFIYRLGGIDPASEKLKVHFRNASSSRPPTRSGGRPSERRLARCGADVRSCRLRRIRLPGEF
ncbi:hypothetical protein [Actinoallomurus sp. NPDC050550]|uniref:hypothetical protein n=1 Tax=Actinoallomurus sp. NPDC050550 TaxID=3154937 RepID=UPI0033D33603